MSEAVVFVEDSAQDLSCVSDLLWRLRQGKGTYNEDSETEDTAQNEFSVHFVNLRHGA